MSELMIRLGCMAAGCVMVHYGFRILRVSYEGSTTHGLGAGISMALIGAAVVLLATRHKKPKKD